MNFESANMALHAAMEGLGVAMGIDALVKDDIEKGKLVRLFEFARLSNFPFQLVTPLRNAKHPKLQALREWLLKEGQKDGTAEQ